MSTEESNKSAFNRELRRKQLTYPDERVVGFLANFFPSGNADRKALDIGFASGRHLRLLLDYEFQAYGIDYAETAAAVARAALGNPPGLKELKSVALASSPFAAGFFDAVISWGTAFLQPPVQMLADLVTTRRMMTSGGRLLVNFRAPENWFHGLGRCLEGETFLLDERAGPYSGMTYTFLDRTGCEKLLSAAGFEIDNVERVELWKMNAAQRHSWWVFTARNGKAG